MFCIFFSCCNCFFFILNTKYLKKKIACFNSYLIKKNLESNISIYMFYRRRIRNRHHHVHHVTTFIRNFTVASGETHVSSQLTNRVANIESYTCHSGHKSSWKGNQESEKRTSPRNGKVLLVPTTVTTHAASRGNYSPIYIFHCFVFNWSYFRFETR